MKRHFTDVECFFDLFIFLEYFNLLTCYGKINVNRGDELSMHELKKAELESLKESVKVANSQSKRALFISVLSLLLLLYTTYVDFVGKIKLEDRGMDDFRLEILKSGKKVLESCRYFTIYNLSEKNKDVYDISIDVEINEDNYEGHVFSNSETKNTFVLNAGESLYCEVGFYIELTNEQFDKYKQFAKRKDEIEYQVKFNIKVDNLINIYPLYKFDENILVENDKMVIIDGS